LYCTGVVLSVGIARRWRAMDVERSTLKLAPVAPLNGTSEAELAMPRATVHRGLPPDS
jgi:hypothetical protein